MASKLDHPSAQRLDAEQFERLRAEVRTLRWVVRERLHRPEWASLIAEVEVLVERVELLDPAREREIEVPAQVCGPVERVPVERVAGDRAAERVAGDRVHADRADRSEARLQPVKRVPECR
ncbi:hypothetical protein [Saccharothrix hoggarensis]